MAPYRFIAGALAMLALVLAAQAAEPGMPPQFKTGSVQTADGATIHVRTGGKGPAVVLIHGLATPATCGGRSRRAWRGAIR